MLKNNIKNLLTFQIKSAIIIYRKGQQRAEPKVLKGGLHNERKCY